MLMRLRDETAEAHHRVEARLFPAALADRSSYAAMLQVLLALHEPREAQLRGVVGLPALGIDLSARQKAPRLRADLAGLGAAPALVPAARLASAAEPAPATVDESDLPRALGTFYVLEGSTLGGRVLLRSVREQLGDVPTAFLSGYGDDTARLWKQTRGALVLGVQSAPDPARAENWLITGALATFDALDQLLTATGWSSA
jgi:heme oxygenase